jgi:predicted Zn finger-like uncharacterized protein
MNSACPTCGAVYAVTPKDVGRKLKCKKCQTALAVTDAGLVVDTPSASAPVVVAAAADDFDTGGDLISAKGKKVKKFAGPPGPSLGERLAKIGGVPTVLFGIGAFLVIVYLFMPIIGQAAIQRAEAAREKLEQERDSKIKKLLPKGKKETDLTGDELKKFQEDRDKIMKDYETLLQEADDDAKSERTSNKRSVWFERYGMMFGFLFVMIGSLLYMMPEQPTIKRVVGAVVITAQMVLVFLSFLIRGAVIG